MLLSSGVIWRHRSLERVPRGVPGRRRARCSALVWERLDDALDWLESLGRRPVRARDGEPAHGRRGASTRGGSTEALVRRRRRAARRAAARRADAARARDRRLPACSARRASCGAARCARTRGATATGSRTRSRAAPRCRRAWTSSTAATCPTPALGEDDFVPLVAALRRGARVVVDERRERVPRRPAGLVRERPRAGDRPAPGGRPGTCSTTRRSRSACASGRCGAGRRRGAGAASTRPSCRSTAPPELARRAFRVAAARHAHDRRARDRRAGARARRRGRRRSTGLYAAGVDAGGIATGGYASGLAPGARLRPHRGASRR